jgi:butyryl-CoA dehydrogenase
MPREESAELLEIRSLAARVADEVFAPLADHLEVMHEPVSVGHRQQLGKLGFLGIAMPAEFGGSELPLGVALAAIEEFAKRCRPAAFQIFEANTGPAQVIRHLGTPEQRARWLPEIIAGDKTMAVAISEPDAGSAATDLRTYARQADGKFVVNGTKRWISNGGEADHYLLYARFNDRKGAAGIGALVVDKDMPGVSFGQPEQLMGFRGIPSADVILQDVEVPLDNLVVAPGGFSSLFRIFSIERLGNATMSLALGQAALDQTVRYVQERQQFGKDLIEFQAVQMTLADMILQVDAARSLIDRAADAAGQGLPDPLQVSIAKCTANEMAKRVTDLAMQLHGGNGYTREYGLERLHRDAHGWAIAGGTPNMQRTRIVSEYVGRRFNQRA